MTELPDGTPIQSHQPFLAAARALLALISPEAKSLMLAVADDYEHLTQIGEAMALIRSVLASAIENDESKTRYYFGADSPSRRGSST